LNGKYTLGRLLGQGGMGAVYEAEAIERKRRVAIKIINPGLTRSQAVLGRFAREARWNREGRDEQRWESGRDFRRCSAERCVF
jgi:serine/threonine protein kinase